MNGGCSRGPGKLKGVLTAVPTHGFFLKLCMLITQHIQAMKIYLLNHIIKIARAQEANLSYSQFEVIHVSKFAIF